MTEPVGRALSMQYQISSYNLFLSMLASIPDDDSCLVWPRCKNRHGYGRVSLQGSTHLVHRLAYTLTHGPIEPAVFACHRCDNPACFRPDHLFAGTQLDNMRDCAQKGRTTIGEAHGHSKLKTADVMEIHRLYRNGTFQRHIAVQFGIDQSTVSDIVNGYRWGRVSR